MHTDWLYSLLWCACPANFDLSGVNDQWGTALETTHCIRHDFAQSCRPPSRYSLIVLYLTQDGDRPPSRSYSLSTGVSETLKVEPARRLLNIMMNGKHGSAKKVGNVINLHFEGNWMPIQVTPSCPLLTANINSTVVPVCQAASKEVPNWLFTRTRQAANKPRT